MFSLTSLYLVFLAVTPLTALLFPLYSTERARNKVASAPQGLIQHPQIQWGKPPWAGCGEVGELSQRPPKPTKHCRGFQTLISIRSCHLHTVQGTSKSVKAQVYMEQSNKKEQNRWRKKRTATNEVLCLEVCFLTACALVATQCCSRFFSGLNAELMVSYTI